MSAPMTPEERRAAMPICAEFAQALYAVFGRDQVKIAHVSEAGIELGRADSRHEYVWWSPESGR